MKVNKITSYICLIITVISGIFFVIFRDNTVLQSILSGIFTGFIVSFVLAIISYFHEREKILQAVDVNLRSMYFNISVIEKITGKALPYIHGSVIIQDLSYKNIYELSKLNIEFFEKMNLGLYMPFFRKSTKSCVCNKLKEYGAVAHTVAELSYELLNYVLEYNIRVNNQMLNKEIDVNEIKNTDELKNLINIRTAKFHEYINSKLIEIDEIAAGFYNTKYNRSNWDDIKFDLKEEAKVW